MSVFQTAPLKIHDLPADDNHCGGPRWAPRYIWLHATGGVDSRKWLSTDPNSQVSCHRLIVKSGRIYKIVPDHVQAWTQGNGVLGTRGPGHGVLHLRGQSALPLTSNLNLDGLSIELENRDDGKDPYPVSQVTACADQVVEWWGAYGFLPILPHSAADPRKKDPFAFPLQLFYQAITARLAVELASQPEANRNV